MLVVVHVSLMNTMRIRNQIRLVAKPIATSRRNVGAVLLDRVSGPLCHVIAWRLKKRCRVPFPTETPLDELRLDLSQGHGAMLGNTSRMKPPCRSIMPEYRSTPGGLATARYAEGQVARADRARGVDTKAIVIVPQLNQPSIAARTPSRRFCGGVRAIHACPIQPGKSVNHSGKGKGISNHSVRAETIQIDRAVRPGTRICRVARDAVDPPLTLEVIVCQTEESQPVKRDR